MQQPPPNMPNPESQPPPAVIEPQIVSTSPPQPPPGEIYQHPPPDHNAPQYAAAPTTHNRGHGDEGVQRATEFWDKISAVEYVDPPMHIILFIINIFVPGIGTIIMSCIGSRFNDTQFLCGLFQFFTCWLLIGWIFSIYTGVLIYQKGTTPMPDEMQRRLV